MLSDNANDDADAREDDAVVFFVVVVVDNDNDGDDADNGAGADLLPFWHGCSAHLHI